MKKILLFVIVLLSASYQINAQVRFSIMPRAGVLISGVQFSDEIKNDNFYPGTKIKGRIGYVAGASFNLAFSDHFSVQPELLYIQKGFKAEFSQQGNTIKGNASINYLEIPLLAKYTFGEDAIRAYFNAGPMIGFGLGGKTKQEFNGQTQEGKVKFGKEPANYQGNDAYFDNSFDFGVQAGGGFGVAVGTGQIVLDFRYSIGLGNLFKKDGNIGPLNDAKSQNRAFAVSVGYWIPIGGN